jgi:hypothetical protein
MERRYKKNQKEMMEAKRKNFLEKKKKKSLKNLFVCVCVLLSKLAAIISIRHR